MASILLVPALLMAMAQGLAAPAAAVSPAYRTETQRAQEALRRGDWEVAEAAAKTAQGLAPREILPYPLRAIALTMLGRESQALAEIKTAIRINPKSSGLLGVHAFVLNRAGLYTKAIEAVDTSIERRPTSSWAWYQLAYSQAGLGDREGSLRSLEQAATLSPDRFAERRVRAGEAGDSRTLLAQFTADPAIEACYFVARQPRSWYERLPLYPILAGFAVLMALFFVRRRIADWLVRIGLAGGGTPIPTGTGTPLLGMPAGSSVAPGQPPPSLPAGYRVLRQIGTGGMGAVYEAEDLALERRVAIKRMRDEIRDDPRERERFLKEARTVAKLRHPGIIEIHAIVEREGEVFLVFEYLDGSTLDSLLNAKKRLDIPEARRLLAQVCSALAYAHSQGVIHRDLKPSNIMLMADGRVKVMDFGVAGQVHEALSRLSMSDPVAGTPAYMAPESETGVVRPESDLYSLAVCLYQMLTGERPFSGTNAGVLLRKTEMRFEPATAKAPGLPPGIDAFFKTALHADPDKRHRTPAAFEVAFAAV